MTRSYRVPLIWSRCSQQTHFRPSFTPSSKTAFFASVSHVIWPPSRLNRVVVRTTSPAAPSLIINTFMLRGGQRVRLRGAGGGSTNGGHTTERRRLRGKTEH